MSFSLTKYPAGGGGGGGTITGANDGLSVLGTIVQLGQTVGQVGNPAAITENREIPLSGNTFQFTSAGGNIVLIDANANESANTQIATGFAPFGGGLGWGFVTSRSTTTATADARGYADQTVFAGNNGIAYAGFDAAQQLFSLGAINYDHTIGFQARPVFDSVGGSITNLYGFGSYMASKHGTTTNWYDFYAEIMNSATGQVPVVTNRYNFYASGDTRATNNWGLYINGAQNNYTGLGITMVGTNVPSSPDGAGPFLFQTASDININGVSIGIGNTAAGTGQGNVRLGQFALQSTQVGAVNNLAIGTGALALLTTGVRNVGIGHNAIILATTGNFNVGIGETALNSLTTGSSNVGIGANALHSVGTGNSNTAIGDNAGNDPTINYTGSALTFLGAGTHILTAGVAGIVQATAVGANTTIAQSNTVVLGTSAESVGIAGINTPTAKLHLPAGTATASTAPLKFTTGILLTTAENGAVEFDGTHFYGTIGSTRFQLDQQVVAGSFILNQTTQQASSNFNISGNGVIGGTMSITGDALVTGNVNVKGNVSSTGNTNPAGITNSGVALSASPNVADVLLFDSTQTVNNRTYEMLAFQGKQQFRFKSDDGATAIAWLAAAGGQGSGITGITSNSGTGAWAHTGNLTTTGNIIAQGSLSSTANTSIASVTNSGINIGAAPTYAAMTWYDQAQPVNARTMQQVLTGGSFVFRFNNDAGVPFTPWLTASNSASGTIGIASNSGSGSWIHTGSFNSSGIINTSIGLFVKEGTNAKQGTATLAAGTVTVSNTNVTANSRIFLTVQSLGTVTTPQAIAITARTAGTSFTITSTSNTDTSVIAYEIFEPGS